MIMHTSLAVCQVSLRLGMTQYTSHIFRHMDAYVSNCIPGYEEMDAVLRFSGTHRRLWRNMVDQLVRCVSEDRVPDADGFAPRRVGVAHRARGRRPAGVS